MSSQLRCLLLVALCLTASLAYPQNGNWNNNNWNPNQRPQDSNWNNNNWNPNQRPQDSNWNNNDGSPNQRPPPGQNPFLPTQAPFVPPTSTAASSSQVTTPSPRYLACLAGCPSTMEYNPVCGTDNISYHNNARLQCAVRCGQNVSMVRLGTCTAL